MPEKCVRFVHIYYVKSGDLNKAVFKRQNKAINTEDDVFCFLTEAGGFQFAENKGGLFRVTQRVLCY